MAMPHDLELRRARLREKLVPLVEAGDYCDPVPTVQEGAVTIDGLLNESVWPLACPEFYLDPESPTPDAPCFCFLTDGDNLFMGARYDLSGLDLSKLEPDSISLRVNLVSLLGDYSREARIRFLPLDSTGGANGRAFVDCPHYNQTIVTTTPPASIRIAGPWSSASTCARSWHRAIVTCSINWRSGIACVPAALFVSTR